MSKVLKIDRPMMIYSVACAAGIIFILTILFLLRPENSGQQRHEWALALQAVAPLLAVFVALALPIYFELKNRARDAKERVSKRNSDIVRSTNIFHLIHDLIRKYFFDKQTKVAGPPPVDLLIQICLQELAHPYETRPIQDHYTSILRHLATAKAYAYDIQRVEQEIASAELIAHHHLKAAHPHFLEITKAADYLT